jgi:hypothetical protein
MTPAQALAEARHLYETRKPTGWRTYSMGGIKVANRVRWYAQQVEWAHPRLPWHEAERAFYGDIATVLAYVNAGADPNLVGDLRQTFRSTCRHAHFIANRIHNSDPADLARRLAIFGLK